jgi:hypothetical protein
VRLAFSQAGQQGARVPFFGLYVNSLVRPGCVRVCDALCFAWNVSILRVDAPYFAFNASARRVYAAASFAGASGGNVSYKVAAVYGEATLPKVAQAAV